MGSPQEGLRASLLADLRTLALEAKRPESLAGQLTGWISGPEHPGIRDAAEKVAEQLSQDDWPTVLTDFEVTLKPFLLACDTKSSKLANFSLSSLQKLLTRYDLEGDALLVIIRALELAERQHDEGVKLKTLQIALTLMQSIELAQNEEGIGAVLGVCFRLLADTKTSDSVASTAMATVRQAVALVFEHVGSMHEPRNGKAGSPAKQNGVGSTADAFPRAGPGLLAQQGAANAALKLLDDLCMMATANEAMLKWLKTPCLPRVFVLDLLDFVLSNSASVFRSVAAFEHALLVRVCQLVTTMLQNLTDPRCERGLQESDLRVVLRLVRTLIANFHTQLRTKCGVLVESLLAGTNPECSLWQRVHVLMVLKQVFSSPQIVHFLFVTYDLQQDSKLNAVTEVLGMFRNTAATFLLAPGDQVALDAISSVSLLYQQRASAGKDWGLEGDASLSGSDLGSAYLCMLALDGLLGFVASLEALTDGRSGEAGHVLEAATPQHMTCVALVDATWRTVLPLLARVLAAASSEALVLVLLKAYSSFTQACGELEMVEARDAFLASLCECTLQAELPRGDVASPTADAAGKDVAVVLTPKNVQALRTLFNIAHRLDHHLGRAWLLVLDNIDRLDRVLHSPRTTTQEVSATSHGATHSSDLAILSTAASQLFESTAGMSTRACCDVLTALQQVSLGVRVSPTPQAPGSPRLFALGRMVEVLLVNLHRLHDLWPLFLAHVVELLGDSRPAIRAACLDALTRAIGGALASVILSPAARLAQQDGEDAATPASAAERMLLAALVELYRDAAEADVRLGLLRILLQALQRHGEKLTAGWEAVLRLLQAVPQGEEEASVALAFQSLQLVAADCMPSLPPELLATVLSVASLYASQQADMNVSLTAINLLWNSADLLVRRGGDGDKGTGSTLSSQQLEELLRYLFRSMQSLSTDNRPEVRNCAARTLFLVVASQGARLSADAWEEVVWQLAFPLLRAVHHMAATSSREETQVEILGKVKGKSVPMVMHHSRNSQQKAWDETLVLALAGMGRLLRAHFVPLAAVSGFDQGWEELMLVLESSLAGGRREVALAAMALLVTVMQAHGASGVLPVPLWKRALRAVGVGVEAAASPQCMVPLAARLELVASIGQLHAALQSVLEPDDVRAMLGWLEGLVKHPFSEADTSPLVPGTLPPVQKAALQVYPTLAPVAQEELWPDFLACLLRLLRPDQLATRPEPTPDPAAKPSARDLKRWATSSLLMESVLALLVEIVRELLPWQQRAANLAMLVSSVGECMATRFRAPWAGLWRAGATAFNAIVAAGLPAVNIACVNEEQPPGPEVWVALATAFEGFLLGGDAEAVSPAEAMDGGLKAEEQLRADAELEASVLDTLADTVLTACTWSPEAARRRLVGVLDQGVVRPPERSLPGGAEAARFPQLCLRKLYVICSRGGSSELPESCLQDVAQVALPLLLNRASQMLEAHVSDAGGQAALEDLQCMLEVLQDLAVSPAVTDAVLPQHGPLKDLAVAARGHAQDGRERLHLLLLYQPLVACMTSPERRVRGLVQDVFARIGVALGLSVLPPSQEPS